MSTTEILSAIDAEIAQLQQVRALLTDNSLPAKRKPGRPVGTVSGTSSPTVKPGERRKLSAESREKIAAAQKIRWANYRKAIKKAGLTASSVPRKRAIASKSAVRKTVGKNAIPTQA